MCEGRRCTVFLRQKNYNQGQQSKTKVGKVCRNGQICLSTNSKVFLWHTKVHNGKGEQRKAAFVKSVESYEKFLKVWNSCELVRNVSQRWRRT